MTKSQYLTRLKKALKGMDGADEIIEYYKELIEDKIENGQTEEEVCANLESPETVAENLRESKGEPQEPKQPEYDFFEPEPPKQQYNPEPEPQKPVERMKEKVRGIPLLFIIIGFPIWFPLLITGLSIAFSAVVVCISLFVAAVVVAVACTASGIYTIIVSFGLIGGHLGIALTQIGIGIAVIGVGVLIAIVWYKVLWLVIALVRKLFRLGDGKPHKIKWKGIAVSASVAVIGVAIGLVGFGSLDFNWKNLSAKGDYTERTVEISVGELFTVDSANLSLVVETTEESPRVVYWDTEESFKQVSCADDVLTIRSEANVLNGFVRAWKYGLFAQADNNKVTVYLPADWSGDFNVKTGNGAVNLQDLTLNAVTFHSQNGAAKIQNSTFYSLTVQSQNGAFDFSNVTVTTSCRIVCSNAAVSLTRVTADSIDLQSQNGALKLSSVTGSSLLYAKNNNGAIKLSNCTAERVELQCTNGSISGELSGKKSEYSISATTQNGRCNLSNSTGGAKTLIAKTSNGSINLSFSAD